MADQHVTSPETASRNEQLLTFLNEAATELAQARDTTTALNKISRLVVPRFADGFTIDLLNNKQLQPLLLKYKDPKTSSLAAQYREAHPIDLNSTRSRAIVARTGKPVLVTDLTAEKMRQLAQDPEHHYAKLMISLRSFVTVPIKIRKKVTGVIRFLSVHRNFDQADLRFAENLAGHIGLALENGRLNEAAQAEIAHRKQVEGLLRQSEAMLGFVVDALPHKVWISAADGVATYYNRGWYHYTGIRGFEQMKKQVWDVIHPEDREIAGRLWPEAVATGREFEVQQRLRRYDGQYRWHLTRASANKDAQGNILRWIGSCTDIHEQKLAQEALQVSESHFKTITQLNSLPIWRVDAKGDTVFINDTWKTFAGVDDEPGSNALWSSNIHPEDSDSALNTYKQQFDLRQPFLMKYRFWYAPNSQYHWMLDHAQPVFNPEFDGYIGTMTDIEEQEQAKLAMQELMAKKDEFISIASHELRTPLTTIKAFFQLLERQDGLPEKPASLVQKTNKQINRLERLIKDLLDVSRINAGKMVYDLSWFELDEVVTDAVESIREHTSSHKIIVGAIPEVRLHADRHRIEQVLLNLLDNAVKYSPGQHEVKIECQQFPDHIRVSITDHGIGMNSDQTRRLFERFYRAENPGNVFQGLGLGLFISAEIVERHGGRFEVLSEPGDGSTFSFTLPISPGA